MVVGYIVIIFQQISAISKKKKWKYSLYQKSSFSTLQLLLRSVLIYGYSFTCCFYYAIEVVVATAAVRFFTCSNISISYCCSKFKLNFLLIPLLLFPHFRCLLSADCIQLNTTPVWQVKNKIEKLVNAKKNVWQKDVKITNHIVNNNKKFIR